MNPERINIAIAQACGYRWFAPICVNIAVVNLSGGSPVSYPRPDHKFLALRDSNNPPPRNATEEYYDWEKALPVDIASIPNYHGDDNAMREARKTLTPEERVEFAFLVMFGLKVLPVNGNEDDFKIIDAPTALQADCFVKAKGLWEEEV